MYRFTSKTKVFISFFIENRLSLSYHEALEICNVNICAINTYADKITSKLGEIKNMFIGY